MRVLEGKERTAVLGVTAASIVLLLAAIRSELGAVAKLQTLNTNKREIFRLYTCTRDGTTKKASVVSMAIAGTKELVRCRPREPRIR